MDAHEKSFDAASDSSKLLITLSTGALGVLLALVNGEAGKTTALMPMSQTHRVLVAGSLVAFVVSAACGIWMQLGVTHVLSTQSHTPNVWSRQITLPMKSQIIAFLLALVLFVGYGVMRLAG